MRTNKVNNGWDVDSLYRTLTEAHNDFPGDTFETLVEKIVAHWGVTETLAKDVVSKMGFKPVMPNREFAVVRIYVNNDCYGVYTFVNMKGIDWNECKKWGVKIVPMSEYLTYEEAKSYFLQHIND